MRMTSLPGLGGRLSTCKITGRPTISVARCSLELSLVLSVAMERPRRRTVTRSLSSMTSLSL